MAQENPPGPDASDRPRRRRWIVLAGALIVAAALLALAFVPYGSASTEIQVSSGATASAAISIPHPGWVTVHFEHPGAMGMQMHYWIQGSSGRMMDHSMMGGGDSYSFWSSGGSYDCGAGYSGSGPSATPVWINVTWGML